MNKKKTYLKSTSRLLIVLLFVCVDDGRSTRQGRMACCICTRQGKGWPISACLLLRSFCIQRKTRPSDDDDCFFFFSFLLLFYPLLGLPPPSPTAHCYYTLNSAFSAEKRCFFSNVFYVPSRENQPLTGWMYLQCSLTHFQTPLLCCFGVLFPFSPFSPFLLPLLSVIVQLFCTRSYSASSLSSADSQASKHHTSALNFQCPMPCIHSPQNKQ